jgi:hypothetical protein
MISIPREHADEGEYDPDNDGDEFNENGSAKNVCFDGEEGRKKDEE